MPFDRPSPMERRFLDLMERIERTQQERIATLEAQVQAQASRIEALEAQSARQAKILVRQGTALNALSASLASFLDPPGSPPGCAG